MSTTKITLFDSLTKELHCNEAGNGFVSLRGLSRMTGVNRSAWGKGGHHLTREIDEYLAESGIEVATIDFSGGIPDFVAAEVIGFYAEEKQSSTAKKYSRTFRAYGLRKLIQDVTKYKAPIRPRLTAQEIIELCCLPAPTVWQKRFPEEYYQHLSRLTGLIVEGIERPMLFAKLTKELVYDYLPTGIYAEVKRCQAETGSWDKLHQFLSDDGVLILETHQRRVLEHMQGAASLEQLRTSLRQACTGQYQLVLLGG
ncbi:MAG: P63C domain-containing protein [Microcoleus sp.]